MELHLGRKKAVYTAALSLSLFFFTEGPVVSFSVRAGLSRVREVESKLRWFIGAEGSA